MKLSWTLCAVLILTAGLVAQTSTGSTAPAKKMKPAPITAADVQALKDAIAAQQQTLLQQQQEIQRLEQQLQQRDQSVQQAQTSASDAASKADAASAEASHSQEQVAALKADVGDLKTGMASAVQTLQETQKTASEAPTTLHYKGINITPGGFAAAEFVRRSRALAADINTPFNSVMMPGASQNTMSEFFGSGRQSRFSLLATGKLKNALLSGYLEADFLSAAVTSNNNESNSYSLRQRQFWGQAAFDNGWSVTGGQMWSLVTETLHGMDNRTEATPLTIDPQYNVGFSWARQYGLRLVKNFNNKVWFGVSMENAQATVTTHNNAANFLVGSAGNASGLYNSAISTCSSASTVGTTGAVTTTTTCSPIANYSFNPSPDLIAKLVFEPGFGHYEIVGVFSHFRDRVFPCAEASATFPCANGATAPTTALAFNPTTNGGGFGANARWTFAQKHLDFGLHGFGGSGIGRYGSGGLPDASIYGDGSLHLVKDLQGLATLQIHAANTDFYFNTGAEYAARTASYDPISGKVVGYGAPSFSNSGCFTETLPANGAGFLPGSLSSCTADTRVLIEGTAGFWYRIYDGSKERVNRGRVQFGPQYSYVDRETWSGAGGLQPHGLDSMIFGSFRYYLP
jgi:hypothetical protein